MQLAKSFGAEVTGVCSTDKVELARSLGADHVVDYTREDFTRSDGRYDLMIDIAGSRSFSECRRVLAPDGTFVIVGGSKANRLLGPLAHSIGTRAKAIGKSQEVVAFFLADVEGFSQFRIEFFGQAGDVADPLDAPFEQHVEGDFHA